MGETGAFGVGRKIWSTKISPRCQLLGGVKRGSQRDTGSPLSEPLNVPFAVHMHICPLFSGVFSVVVHRAFINLSRCFYSLFSYFRRVPDNVPQASPSPAVIAQRKKHVAETTDTTCPGGRLPLLVCMCIMYAWYKKGGTAAVLNCCISYLVPYHTAVLCTPYVYENPRISDVAFGKR